MKTRPVQYFSKEYLERCKEMTPVQILEFEENFQKLLLQEPYKIEIERDSKNHPDIAE